MRRVRCSPGFVVLFALTGALAGLARPGIASARSRADAASEALSILGRDDRGGLVVQAIRLDVPLTLDGGLDEAVYSRIVPASDFVQQEPREGQPATDRTETWVFYDDRTLYVAARCWQPTDVKLVANEMRRDNRTIFENDNFAVILDTFRDGRNGFYFQTNPLAAVSDAYVTDESGNNRDWNTVWDVRTGRFEGGWTVEIAIPFKSLRYPSSRDQTWGINFRRIVRARPEISFLVQVPASTGNRGIMRVSLAPPLVGVTTPAPGLNLEVKPFAIAVAQTDRTIQPPPDDFDGDAGFDLKYGVTKSLTFDFTYNTDFAQVEEDELQVNLTRFDLYFPEKREFFLEGQGIFSFGGAQAGGGGGGSRQRGPSNTPVLFFSRRIGLVEERSVPIDVGARLSGKAGAWSVGLLDVQTDEAPEVAAPATNFSVVRVKRDVLRRSAIGMIATNRSRTLDAVGSNQVFGVDANFAFFQNVAVVAYAAKTWTPDRTGDDTSYRGQFQYAGDRYGLDIEQLYVGEDFNPEIGFLRREDFRRWFGQARWSPRPSSVPAVRKWGIEPSFEYITSASGVLESRQAQVSTFVELADGDEWSLDLERNLEVLDEPFEVSDEVTIPIGSYRFDTVQTRYEFGPQRRVSGAATIGAGGFYGGTRREVGWRGRVEVSPQLSIEPGVSFNWVDLPEPQSDFTTQLVSARTNFTLSPRLLTSALVQYNSADHVAQASVRFRWEYRPGSDLFVVYSEGRDTTWPGTPVLSNRSFTVKLTRLFRF